MSHNNREKVMLSFEFAIRIAENKIIELEGLCRIDERKKPFYESGIKLAMVVREMYYAFHNRHYRMLANLNQQYNDNMIDCLEILEELVGRNIFTENEYLVQANSFKIRKEEYDVMCGRPEIVRGIVLCSCCIPKNLEPKNLE